MTLLEIADALKIYTTGKSFDTWIVNNESSLSNFFYGLNGYDLNDLQFDSFYFGVLSSSSVYKKYHSSKSLSEPFLFFLNLISVAAEKLSEIGSTSLTGSLIADLPDSASKLRLKAIQEFALVENVRTSYIQKFPVVLDLLDHARLSFEEENVRQAVDVLMFYYKKAKKALEDRGYKRELKQLRSLYEDEILKAKYPFLSHAILIDLLSGKDPFALYPAHIKRECLIPSMCIRALFSSFNSNYFLHPDVNHQQDNLWGYSKKQILDDILVRGRGDFSVNYGKISADDKVMLYCFFNLKKHFFTSYAVFQTVLKSLEAFFTQKEYKPVFIDLGCGPMTSGLALADLIHTITGTGICFSYIGIDIADAMINKAKSFQNLEIFSNQCSFQFENNWNDITHTTLNDLAGKNNPIIFNASYLFASSSVDPEDLAAYVLNVAKNFPNTFFIFQNPNREDRNVKYDKFKSLLNPKSIVSGVENIRYKAASFEANEDVSYEILKL